MMTLKRILMLLLWSSSFPAFASTEYIFATFKGDDLAGELLSIYTSPDALNFTLLKDTGWGGQTWAGIEGPSIAKLSDGTWRMFIDPQAAGTPYKYMNSPDLNTWSGLITLPGSLASVVRHGTIFRDTTFGITSIAAPGASAQSAQPDPWRREINSPDVVCNIEIFNLLGKTIFRSGATFQRAVFSQKSGVGSYTAVSSRTHEFSFPRLLPPTRTARD